MKPGQIQTYRLFSQATFFILIAVLPIFDLLRFDLTAGHAFFMGSPWRVANNPLSVVLLIFVPLLSLAAAVLLISWKWGRLYCGWLCPHFSVVETINRLMLMATGKHSLWDTKENPPWEPSGAPRLKDKRYWLLVVPAVVLFAFSWAVVGLTYLMSPFHVYEGLFTGNLYRGEIIFLSAATTVLSLEFLFARHLFCRYACAVGLFQSLAWMGNKKAMVVGFKRENLTHCAECLQGSGSACDAVCPMRLKPRTMKRWMFACTQCGQCISACNTVQKEQPLLHWAKNEEARQNEAGFSAVKHKD